MDKHCYRCTSKAHAQCARCRRWSCLRHLASYFPEGARGPHYLYCERCREEA